LVFLQKAGLCLLRVAIIIVTETSNG
jgi:hypothetical protein